MVGDYTVGTDMTIQRPTDTEEVLHINRKKYYNFDIDMSDKVMDYVNDEDSSLIKNSESELERIVDTEFLTLVEWVKPGNWIGINQRSLEAGGGGDGADTSASIVTSATGGTITIDADGPGAENWVNGTLYRLGFNASELGRPIRLVSTSGYATDWWRILSVTSSAAVTVENWDGRVQTGNDSYVGEGDILYGLHGEGRANKTADGGPTNENGWFYEIQASVPTTMTSSNVYNAIVELKTALDENDCPDDERYLIIDPALEGFLLKASQLQPAIAMAYEAVILNGKVGKVAGFDIILATGSKVSTRAGRQTIDSDYGDWVNGTFTAGATGSQALACHKAFCTFAHKWSESRVIDSTTQFAKLYQGLNLFGMKVPAQRRKLGAVLYYTV